MGAITSKFRKKKTTYEVLESIDTEIKSIEEFQRNTELIRKRIVGRFVMLAVALYVITAFLFYFYCFPANIYDRLFYIIPLLFAPVLILLVKQTLTWYYQRKISRKQTKLVDLRSRKKDMLEKVMDTETYKVAKSILDKFAPPEPIRKLPEAVTPARHVKPPLVPPTTVNAGLRQRAISPKPSVVPTPMRPLPGPQRSTAVISRTPAGQGQPMLPMPRTILPKERTAFDRMVDYLVGDGPSNRYALICNKCYGHNGMAYRDEAEYMSFRCCYCYTFNPALKKRPVAPKFEYELQSPQDSDSDSEKNSPSDSSSESDEGVAVLKPAQQVEDSSETAKEEKVVENSSETVEEVVEEDQAKDQTVQNETVEDSKTKD